MSVLTATDILKFAFKYEPSKPLIWEFVRGFDPREIAKFIYVLDNVTKEPGRKAVDVDFGKFTEYFTDKKLIVDLDPTVKLERVQSDFDTLWNYSQEYNDGTSITQTITDIMDMSNHLNVPITDDLQRILNHNLGSSDYNIFSKNIQNLLMNENFHNDRTMSNVPMQSLVEKFIQFCAVMQSKSITDNDPRNFRFLLTPKPQRITSRVLPEANTAYCFQPLYQGFLTIVHSTSSETKCYNRHGEMYPNLGHNIRSKTQCTFEAVILPLDKLKHPRSWRYWKWRNGWIMYIVDVYGYGDKVFHTLPFVERIKYAKLISAHDKRLLEVPPQLSSWNNIEKVYVRNKDVYDPIVGVIIRRASSVLSQRIPPLEFRFNILYCFDLLENKIVNLTLDVSTRKMHFALYETADYKTTCMAYGHSQHNIYLCSYNRSIHKFVHSTTLDRVSDETLEYKKEALYVVNNQVVPRGVLFLRVYYVNPHTVIGYESKMGDGMFNVPFRNHLTI